MLSLYLYLTIEARECYYYALLKLFITVSQKYGNSFWSMSVLCMITILHILTFILAHESWKVVSNLRIDSSHFWYIVLWMNFKKAWFIRLIVQQLREIKPEHGKFLVLITQPLVNLTCSFSHLKNPLLVITN